jgi:hypothetical protein
MRVTVLVLVCVSFLLAQTPAPQPEKVRPVPVSTISQLMIDVIYPTSNDLFYIYREPPKSEVEWGKIRQSALTLAESGNLLMGAERAYDDEDWLVDAKLVVEVGRKAYKAAQEKNLQAIVDLNDELNDSCVQCHMDYRQRYGRRTLATKAKEDAKAKDAVKEKGKQ